MATDQLNVQLSVHSKEKETVGLPAAPSSIAHQSSSPHPYLHLFQPLLPTGSSLFRRGWERRRRSSADERQRQKCCLWVEKEEGVELKWPLCDGGEKKGTVGEKAGSGLLISLTQHTVRWLLMNQVLVGSSWNYTNRNPTVVTECEFCCTVSQAPHAQTCLMWKFTTYSALVRWTEMAKGSNGWKVKATRRLTAWFTGRPRSPAWILNFSSPESRA